MPLAFLSGKGTWLARVQFGVHHDLQVLLCQAAFQLGGPQRLLVCEIVPPQVQHFECLTELYEVPVSPFLQPVKVPLDGSLTLWFISHSFQFCRGYTLPHHPDH